MTLPPSPNPLPTTEGAQLRDALAWALAELRGETRYENPQQVAKCFESAYAALSAPTTEGLTQGWQDIATAPRDGSAFLTWNGKNYAIDNYSKSDGDFSNLVMERLVQRIGDADDELRLTTDWMPLPPPPGQT